METSYLLHSSIKEIKKNNFKDNNTNAETTKFIELDYPHSD